MFVDGQFSNLLVKNIEDKKVFIVDKHHYVLPIWASLAIENNMSYILVTIDYHPDTIRGFNDYAFAFVQKQNSYHCDYDEVDKICKDEVEKLKKADMSTLIKSVRKLSNDEHIRTAYDLGFLKEYHVINCMDTYDEPGSFYYKNEKCYNLCIPTIKTGICNGKCPSYLLKYKSNRLEDEYLTDIGFSVPSEPYILDFDLDYFPTRESMNPLRRTIINKLIKNAEIITVAIEKQYFNKCKKERGFTVKEAETKLMEIINTAQK